MEAVDTTKFDYDIDRLRDYGTAIQAARTGIDTFKDFSFNHSHETFRAIVDWLSRESRHVETLTQLAKQSASVRIRAGYALDTSRLLDIHDSGFIDDVKNLTSRFASGFELEASDALLQLASEALKAIDSDVEVKDLEEIAAWADDLARDCVARND